MPKVQSTKLWKLQILQRHETIWGEEQTQAGMPGEEMFSLEVGEKKRKMLTCAYYSNC